MRRRDFLVTAVAVGPAATLAADGQVTPVGGARRPTRALRVAARADRFGETIVLNGVSPNDCKVSGQDTGGALSIFESTIAQKGGPPRHVHLDQDEWFYIIEGEFDFVVGDERFRLRAGESVLAPRQVPHTWARVSDTQGKMTIAFQPAGQMEEFFRALGKIATPQPEQMQRLFLDHGMRVVGPPLASE